MEVKWSCCWARRERQSGDEVIGRVERKTGPGTYKKDRNRQDKKSDDGCRTLGVGSDRSMSTHMRSVS